MADTYGHRITSSELEPRYEPADEQALDNYLAALVRIANDRLNKGAGRK